MKVFIAGANSDIGIATCEKYLNNNWEVVAHFRSSSDQLLDLQVKFPNKIKIIKADFLDLDNLIRLLRVNQEILDECDSLINCVGYSRPVPYDDITESDLIEHFKINMMPNILLIQFFSKIMMKKK